MLVPNRNNPLNTTNNGGYRYGFQGQEKDDEIKGSKGTSLNYKFRMHDPRVGRFFATDPLTKKYPHYSPYGFSGNKVLNSIGREGLEDKIVITDIYNDGSNTPTNVQTITDFWRGRTRLNLDHSMLLSLKEADENVLWADGSKQDYFRDYNNKSILNLWRCGSYVCHNPPAHGVLNLIKIHSKNNILTLATYERDYNAEALDQASKDIIEGGVTMIGGAVTLYLSEGIAGESAMGAVIFGGDQLTGGIRLLKEVKNGTYKPSEGTDRRPIRNFTVMVFGENGGKTYDLVNVVYNLTEGTFAIYNAPNEVLKVFTEISRINSSISVHDGTISIFTTDTKDTENKKPDLSIDEKDNKKP